VCVFAHCLHTFGAGTKSRAFCLPSYANSKYLCNKKHSPTQSTPLSSFHQQLNKRKFSAKVTQKYFTSPPAPLKSLLNPHFGPAQDSEDGNVHHLSVASVCLIFGIVLLLLILRPCRIKEESS